MRPIEPIHKSKGGFQQVECTTDGIQGLVIPEHATEADVTIEQASGSTATYPIRSRRDQGVPTSTLGNPSKNGDVLVLIGNPEIMYFKAVSTEAGKSHKLNIQFYKKTA